MVELDLCSKELHHHSSNFEKKCFDNWDIVIFKCMFIRFIRCDNIHLITTMWTFPSAQRTKYDLLKTFIICMISNLCPEEEIETLHKRIPFYLVHVRIWKFSSKDLVSCLLSVDCKNILYRFDVILQVLSRNVHIDISWFFCENIFDVGKKYYLTKE